MGIIDLLWVSQSVVFRVLTTWTVCVFLLTDINPASVQASHGDAEALSLLAEPVTHWHLAVLKYHRPGRLRVPAHLEDTLQNN